MTEAEIFEFMVKHYNSLVDVISTYYRHSQFVKIKARKNKNDQWIFVELDDETKNVSSYEKLINNINSQISLYKKAEEEKKNIINTMEHVKSILTEDEYNKFVHFIRHN